jgi:hypothetical protein
MKRSIIRKTVLTAFAAILPVFLIVGCPMDNTPENSPSSYTISYSPCEGSGSIASVTKKAGETAVLSDGSGFTAPEDKTFDNWKDGAGNAYAGGSSYSKDEDLSLTAQWKAVEKKTVLSELEGWNVMVASAGDVDAIKVPNAEHSYDGDSSKIHYDSGARVLTYWYNSEKRTANLASPADDEFHLLLTNIGTGNEVQIGGGKVSSLYKMVSSGWSINFDTIQSIIASGYVQLGNWASTSNQPIEIFGTFTGTTLSFVGSHDYDAFTVPDGSSLTIPQPQVLSFNSSSHLVLGAGSSLILKADAQMRGYGKLVAGQTEFSFGDSEDSGWWINGTGDVTITCTDANTSSITATGSAYLSAFYTSTNLPAITQKQGNAGNSLTIGCLVYLGANESGTLKGGSMILEGTGTNKGLVKLSGNGIIVTNSPTPNDSMGDSGTGISNLNITGGTPVLRKRTGTNEFLFIRSSSGETELGPSGSSDVILSAETPVS